MAQQSICDICREAKKTFKVAVAVSVHGWVRDNIVTGTSDERDVCDDCMKNGAMAMAGDVSDKLIHDLPLHKDAEDVLDEMTPIQEELKSAVIERDAIDEKATGELKVKRMEADAKVQGAVVRLKALENKRLEILRKGS